jgi:hypothetical protein
LTNVRWDFPPDVCRFFFGLRADLRPGVVGTVTAVRTFSLLLLVALMVASCRVAVHELRVAATAPSGGVGALAVDTLPAVGPIPASSHWHAAYVVRVCDDVMPPLESDNDPLGIHSHGDGLIHVHPFFEESGYELARMGLFADAMGFGLSDGELTLPGGGTWRDGDLCNGIPGRVFVDRWASPDPESQVERIFQGLDEIRYQADGELYQIAFAPADSFPVVPPAVALLPEVSNLALAPEPWIDLKGFNADAGLVDAAIWKIGAVGAEPCGTAIPERVLFGAVRCFEIVGDKLAAGDAVESARAVALNRQPAVELQMTSELRALINNHFASSTNPLALAIEVGGFVLSAPQIQRPPVSDRLVVSGGFSVDSAERLAEILNS